MGRIPVRFERVAAAFQADIARVRPCESGITEHAPEELADLSDLVKSFMEREGEEEDAVGVGWDDGDEDLEWFDSEKREILQRIFGGDDDAKQLIRREVEHALELVGENKNSSPQFKSQLLSHLREKGFDAGELLIHLLVANTTNYMLLLKLNLYVLGNRNSQIEINKLTFV